MKSHASETSHNSCFSGLPLFTAKLMNLEPQTLIEKNGMLFDLVGAVSSCATLITENCPYTRTQCVYKIGTAYKIYDSHLLCLRVERKNLLMPEMGPKLGWHLHTLYIHVLNREI